MIAYYKITPAMHSMQEVSPWRLQTFIDFKPAGNRYFATLNDVHKAIATDRRYADLLIVQMWEHDTFYHLGKLVMSIKSDDDWAIAILKYGNEAKSLFATGQ